MNCVNPVRIQIKTKTGYASYRYPDGLQVPCGKCIACRIQKKSEWVLRLYHELEEHDNSSFVTLTYSDEYLPDYGTLRKNDLQLFIKRLRKRMEPIKIKYFACGEYGDLEERPHYHIILFGVGLLPDHKQQVMDSWTYCDWSFKAIRNKAFGLVEPDSINYVCKYVEKKLSGEMAENEYDKKHRSPIFRILSTGIGATFCDRYSSDLKENQYCTYRGAKKSLPRYYVKRLGLTNEMSKDMALNKDCEVTEKHTGIYISEDELYKSQNNKAYQRLSEGKKGARKQHKATLERKASLKQSKL